MNPDLSLLTEQIVKLVDPLKIILFGSRAKDPQNTSSDYDLLIIMPLGTNKRKTAQFLYQNIENVKKPYDLIVATEETLSKYSNSQHLIYYHAIKDGIELYADTHRLCGIDSISR